MNIVKNGQCIGILRTKITPGGAAVYTIATSLAIYLLNFRKSCLFLPPKGVVIGYSSTPWPCFFCSNYNGATCAQVTIKRCSLRTFQNCITFNVGGVYIKR